jgi:hypothetical protein
MEKVVGLDILVFSATHSWSQLLTKIWSSIFLALGLIKKMISEDEKF